MSTDADKAKLVAALGGFGPLGQLSEAQRAEVADALRVRSYSAGAQLFREGEPCEGFWTVVEGSVCVYRLSQSGRTQTLNTFGPGQSFAVVPAVDAGAYPASAEARVDSRVVLVPIALFHRIAANHPAIGWTIAQSFALRLRKLTAKVASLGLRAVRGRVAAYLLERVEGQGDGESITIVLDEAQDAIARQLGTSREAVARTLRSLREDGILDQRRERVVVLQPDALRQAATL